MNLSSPADTAASFPWVDTFAEAFPITGLRLIVTAVDRHWTEVAANVFCGNATSVIACDVEAGVERFLSATETPDGRPGVSLLAFGFSRDKLGQAVASRVGQCILTCPTTACFNGIEDSPADKQVSIGGLLRFFGDGHQISKRIANKRYWRIPVMDGEFLCEDKFGTTKGVAGGNLLIGATRADSALSATMAAAEAMRQVPGIILPFPGGIVRSGSKVGSRYPNLKASTNDAYCPSLMTQVASELPAGTEAMYEIVIDGLSLEAVRNAMQAGLASLSTAPHLTIITAGNYGGKLGPYHIYLRDLIS